MNIDMKYFISKIKRFNEPINTTKELITYLIINFINGSLQKEMVYEPIQKLKIKIKYIKKYMKYGKDFLYIEELIEQYQNEKINNLVELEEISKQLDSLTEYVNDLYVKSLKKIDIVYNDKDLGEYIEILNLEDTLKIPKISSTKFKAIDINDKDIEVVDYLDRTIKLSKKDLKIFDIEDNNIEILNDFDKTQKITVKENDDIEILDILDKTVKIPKLTKKQLKELDINDKTIEVLNFLDKTTIIPKKKLIDLNDNNIEILNDFDKTVILNKKEINNYLNKAKARKDKRNRIIFGVSFAVLCIVFSISTIRIALWYKDNLDLKKEISEISSTITVKELYETSSGEIEEIDKKEKYGPLSIIDVDFTDLINRNDETFGWIYVPNTNINYPFVQTNNNSFYLDHSFNKKSNEAGWVFMDYRNNREKFDANTIIYAHGRLDKTMFGSLRNILEEEWYINEDNHYVKLSTLASNSLWEVFSVYKIDTETYYIQNNFNDKESHTQFLKTLRNRSVYDFDVKLSTDDKILTLSTCYDNFKKVVLHAKLIKIQDKK